MIQGFDGKIQDNENLSIDYSENYEEEFFSGSNSFEQSKSQFDLSKIPVQISGLGFDLFAKLQ